MVGTLGNKTESKKDIVIGNLIVATFGEDF